MTRTDPRPGRRTAHSTARTRDRARAATKPLLAVLTAAACALPGCSDPSRPGPYEAPRDADRVIVGLGAEITSNGTRTLRVEADSGFAAEGSSVLALVGVRGQAFDENGIVRVMIQADSGRLDEASRTFTAMGTVRARRQDGTVTVETSEMAFDPTTGRLRSDSVTVVELQGRTERGTCFESDPLLTDWTVCGSTP